MRVKLFRTITINKHKSINPFIGNFARYLFFNIEESSRIIHELGFYENGVMVKEMDCGIVVREFVLQSRYYVRFRANTLGKGMNPLILPAMG